MNQHKTFFSYVIPSLLAFTLSGIYAVVDGFFIGNSIGDIGLSTISIAGPILVLIQALGTGIGMGGSVIYSLSKASGDKKKASAYTSGTMLLLFITSITATILLYVFTTPLLKLLGAEGRILSLGEEYSHIIILGGILQIYATGVVPMIRNCGGASFAMVSMMFGFLTNIVLDFLFVWVLEWGLAGAASATIIGQGVTMVMGLAYLLIHRIPLFHFPLSQARSVFQNILQIGFAPFGLTLSPVLSLILMNRYSMLYTGEQAVACYACISYATSIVYMLLQGIGDGSQPLMSQYYGKGAIKEYRYIRFLAYAASMVLAVLCILILFFGRYHIGRLMGTSPEVMTDIAQITPIFLISIPFLAFTRITTAGFYATEQNTFSYILVYAEPVLLFILLLIIPRFGKQAGVWWSMCLAQIIPAVIALGLKQSADNREQDHLNSTL